MGDPRERIMAALLALLACRGSSTAAPPGADKPAAPTLFQRDQPSARALIPSWNGGPVVVADTFYALDIAGGRASRVTLPGGPAILGLATFAGAPVALCGRREGLYLAVKGPAGWTERTIPDDLGGHGADTRLAADDASLVLWRPGKLHRLRGDKWSSLDVGAPPVRGTVRGPADSMLLVGDVLYAAWARGEWGGGLAALDLATGRWSAPEDREHRALSLPVSSLMAHGGKLWAVAGLAHMGLEQGALVTFDARSLTTVAATDAAGWTLGSASFEGLAFDDAGRPLVLTGRLGVVRADAPGAWTRLTPAWPKDFVYVSALGVTGTTLLIVTYDAGVLLWDHGAGDVRRVTLTTKK